MLLLNDGSGQRDGDVHEVRHLVIFPLRLSFLILQKPPSMVIALSPLGGVSPSPISYLLRRPRHRRMPLHLHHWTSASTSISDA